jgi:uncharacterized protein
VLRRWVAPVVVAAMAAVACAPGDGAPLQASPPPAPPAGFFTNGDIQLSYRLDLPSGSPPFPGVVLGHGSGRQTKDNLRQLAAGLVRHGYAVLSFDKRGVGESTGVYSGVGVANGDTMFDLLAGDMAAGVAFMASQPQIDRARIGLMGVSQAGWIIPLAATKAKVAFVILISGPTVSVGEENYYSDIVEFTAGTPLEEAYSKLEAFKGPKGFDPRPTLERLNVRALWLFGEDDRSIPVRNSVKILESLARAGRPFSWRVYPGQGHSLYGFWDDVYQWLDNSNSK